MSNYMINETVKGQFLKRDQLKDLGITKEEFDEYKIVWKGDFSISLLLGMFGFILISDLEIRLIINESNYNFITSDNPVVLINPFYATDDSRNHNGLQSPGLVIFVPINQKKGLLLYDRTHYSTNSHNGSIKVTDEQDIIHLNSLQFLNCYYNVFYEDISDSIINKWFKLIEDKIPKKPKLVKFKEFHNSNSKMVMISSYEIKFREEMKFLIKIVREKTQEFARDYKAVDFFDLVSKEPIYDVLVKKGDIKEISIHKYQRLIDSLYKNKWIKFLEYQERKYPLVYIPETFYSKIEKKISSLKSKINVFPILNNDEMDTVVKIILGNKKDVLEIYIQMEKNFEFLYRLNRLGKFVYTPRKTREKLYEMEINPYEDHFDTIIGKFFSVYEKTSNYKITIPKI